MEQSVLIDKKPNAPWRPNRRPWHRAWLCWANPAPGCGSGNARWDRSGGAPLMPHLSAGSTCLVKQVRKAFACFGLLWTAWEVVSVGHRLGWFLDLFHEGQTIVCARVSVE